jgi:glycosyltransferase involved in cell wall biosynthesis
MGDGPARAELEALRRTLGLESTVDILPHAGRQELERAADAAWVQVVPSVWEEPFGLAAAEAMMRGTAVVASGSGGLADVVRDVDSLSLTPPGDVDALASTLAVLLSDRDRCERVGAAGRVLALERFTPDRVVDRFLYHYRRLGVPSSAA